MIAYISYWNGGVRRIGTTNIGGATEVDIPQAEYDRLRQMQDSCDTFQKALAHLVQGTSN